ncbi:MAG: hypothetical protein ACLQAT_12645 [Candidatus Binataceae bacterium]
MKIRFLAVAAAITGLASTTWITAAPAPAAAQQSAMKDDVEQFAMDLHVAMDRSSLTEQQKEQMRGDLKKLREAHQNHEPIKEMRAARGLRSMLDSGAFKLEDQARLKQDMQAIRQARGDKMGGGGL